MRRTAQSGHLRSPSLQPLEKRPFIPFTQLAHGWNYGCQENLEGGMDVKPMAAALTGALVAGVGMYAIGARAQDGFAMNPALAGYPAMSFNTAVPQPLAQPVAYAPGYEI